MVKEITEVFDYHPKDSNRGKFPPSHSHLKTLYQTMLKILTGWQNT